MFRTFAAFILIAVTLSACATVPSRNPEAEIRVSEAKVVMDPLADQMRRFFTDVGVVLEEIAVMSSHPGWPEMEEIIRTGFSAGSTEGDSASAAKNEADLNLWSQKWNASGDEMYSKYLSLVDRCNALEVRRLTLRVKLMILEAKLLGATALELSVGRYPQAESISKSVDELAKFEDELGSYKINVMELYEVTTPR